MIHTQTHFSPFLHTVHLCVEIPVAQRIEIQRAHPISPLHKIAVMGILMQQRVQLALETSPLRR